RAARLARGRHRPDRSPGRSRGAVLLFRRVLGRQLRVSAVHLRTRTRSHRADDDRAVHARTHWSAADRQLPAVELSADRVVLPGVVPAGDRACDLDVTTIGDGMTRTTTCGVTAAVVVALAWAGARAA